MRPLGVIPKPYSQFGYFCSWALLCILVPHHVPTPTREITFALTADHLIRTLTVG